MLKNCRFRSAGNVIRNAADAVVMLGGVVLLPAGGRLPWRRFGQWLLFNLLLSLWTAALILDRVEHGLANILLVAAVFLLVRNVSRR